MFDFLNNAGSGFVLVKMLIPAWMAILFLQSGLDKVLDYKGNWAYFKDHFKNSLFANIVGILLPVITILEVASGVLCAIGTVSLLLSGNTKWAFVGLLLSGISLLNLFLGQRIAKDYAGAVSLSSYFVLVVIGLLLLV